MKRLVSWCIRIGRRLVKEVYENESGASLRIQCLHFFNAHPPKRTVKFIGLGSEDGSHANLFQNEEALMCVRIRINVDSAGPILGRASCSYGR